MQSVKCKSYLTPLGANRRETPSRANLCEIEAETHVAEIQFECKNYIWTRSSVFELFCRLQLNVVLLLKPKLFIKYFFIYQIKQGTQWELSLKKFRPPLLTQFLKNCLWLAQLNVTLCYVICYQSQKIIDSQNRNPIHYRHVYSKRLCRYVTMAFHVENEYRIKWIHKSSYSRF